MHLITIRSVLFSFLVGIMVVPTQGQVKWLTFEEAVTRGKTDPRPVFIDVYTNWCGWCKVMDRETFADPIIAGILNDKFYPVKFNAEQREEVQFDGVTFKFVPDGGYHQLAAALLNNKLSYPTVVFLNEKFQMIQPVPGFRKAPEFHKIVAYLGSGDYKSIPYLEWQKTYKSPY